jgi:transposase
MRRGISLSVLPADLDRLRALVRDRSAPQKHVWRAWIVLLSAEGAATNAIVHETGKSKTCVCRWQERFAAEGFEGLLRDKTRPSRIKKLDPAFTQRAVPAGKTIHAILDNYAAHKHPAVRQWLARHPRWIFHFTPTQLLWLNAVEGFFATLTKRRLKRGVFRSVVGLQAAINRFLEDHNANSKPFQSPPSNAGIKRWIRSTSGNY